MLFSGSACLSGDDLAEGQQCSYMFFLFIFYLLRGGLQEPLTAYDSLALWEQLSSHHATQA